MLNENGIFRKKAVVKVRERIARNRRAISSLIEASKYRVSEAGRFCIQEELDRRLHSVLTDEAELERLQELQQLAGD